MQKGRQHMNYNPNQYKPIPCGVMAGWERVGDAPVMGGAMGTVFDNYVIYENGVYRMWFSWRPTLCIVHATSKDGVHWSLPEVVLTSDPSMPWECDEVSRPTLIKKDGKYLMWYTSHDWNPRHPTCVISFATSDDGLHWKKYGKPVMQCDQPWEKDMIWCPHVIYEEEEDIFKMWYSGGAEPNGEADAIGYATSKDGIHWEKHVDNPIFAPDRNCHWEMYKVSACFVFKQDGWYYMTYLGSDSDMRAANGMARSRDGITNWQRHPDNPVFGAVEGAWDCAGVCKVSVLKQEDGYIGWYNGFSHVLEEMGVYYHKGFDFDFPPEGTTRPSKRGDGDCTSKINYVWLGY